MKSFILLTFLIAACASTPDAAEWAEVTISQKDMDWRWCSENLDGPDFANKGFCHIGKECRKRFLKKDECRPKPYFCAFTDQACMTKNDFQNKKLIQKDAINFLE